MTDDIYVALINNLGGTTELEISILAEDLRRFTIGEKITHIIAPASLMTALDMHGFSISLLPLTPEYLRLLQAPAALRKWPGVYKLMPPKLVPVPNGLKGLRPLPSFDPVTADFLTNCCRVLIAAEQHLNTPDAKSGDGDTGTTLAAAALALIDGMDQLPLSDLTQLYRALGQDLSQTMGGSSGVLLAIFFCRCWRCSVQWFPPERGVENWAGTDARGWRGQAWGSENGGCAGPRVGSA